MPPLNPRVLALLGLAAGAGALAEPDETEAVTRLDWLKVLKELWKGGAIERYAKEKNIPVTAALDEYFRELDKMTPEGLAALSRVTTKLEDLPPTERSSVRILPYTRGLYNIPSNTIWLNPKLATPHTMRHEYHHLLTLKDINPEDLANAVWATTRWLINKEKLDKVLEMEPNIGKLVINKPPEVLKADIDEVKRLPVKDQYIIEKWLSKVHAGRVKEAEEILNWVENLPDKERSKRLMLGMLKASPIELVSTMAELLTEASSHSSERLLQAREVFPPKIWELGRKANIKFGGKYLLPFAAAAGVAAGAEMLSPDEAEARKIGTYSFIAAKKLLRDFKVGDIVTLSDIRERYVGPDSWIYSNVVNPLIKRGILEKTSRGKYKIVSADVPKPSNPLEVFAQMEEDPRTKLQLLKEFGYTDRELQKVIEAVRIFESLPPSFYGIPDARYLPNDLAILFEALPVYLRRETHHIQFRLPPRAMQEIEEKANEILNELAAQEPLHPLGMSVSVVVNTLSTSSLIDSIVRTSTYRRLIDEGWFGRDLGKVANRVWDKLIPVREQITSDIRNAIQQGLAEGINDLTQLTQYVLQATHLPEVPEAVHAVQRIIAPASESTFRKNTILKAAIPYEDYLQSPMVDDFMYLARIAPPEGLSLKDMKQSPRLFSIYSRWKTELGKLAKGAGVVKKEDLLKAAQTAPLTDFYLTKKFWTYEAQSLARVPHDVYIVNVNPAGFADKDALADFYVMNVPIEGHPNEPNRLTVGWLRVDKTSTPGVWIIEEVQSDLLAMLNRAKRHGLTPVSQETIKRLEKWAETAIAKVLDDARKEGIKMVMLHTPESLQKRGGATFGERKLHELYLDQAKRFGFEVGELRAEQVQHLQRNFKTLPMFVRVPSIVAFISGIALLEAEESEAVRPPSFKPLQPKALTETVKRAIKEGAESSAASGLVGKELLGKKVVGVYKGKADWRYIVFDDGTYVTVDKNQLWRLMGELGRQKYGEAFEKGLLPSPARKEEARFVLEDLLQQYGKVLTPEQQKEVVTKLLQRLRESTAWKALDREVASREYVPKKPFIDEWEKRWSETAIKFGLKPEAMVEVKYLGKRYVLMKKYAEFLQQMQEELGLPKLEIIRELEVKKK